MRQLAAVLLSALALLAFRPTTRDALTPHPALRSAAAEPTASAQLPSDIMIDRLLLRVDRLLAADDPAAALDAMNEILAIHDEHDLHLRTDFHFRYGRIAFAAGRTATAIASLKEYVIAATRAGPFYRDALELLDSAEQTLAHEVTAPRRAAVERHRLTDWPPGQRFRDCAACPEMVVLPRSHLALGRYEVTLGEYRAFASTSGRAASGGCYGRSDRDDYSWRNPNFPQTDRHPVTCLSLNDAQLYLSWLSLTSGAAYRLPTSEEWMRAAQGSQPGCHRNRTGRVGTCPVGSYNSNPLGLSDMWGNVWEWTSDCWENDCSIRPVHGGGWSNAAHVAGGADLGDPFSRANSTGFRVARTLD